MGQRRQRAFGAALIALGAGLVVLLAAAAVLGACGGSRSSSMPPPFGNRNSMIDTDPAGHSSTVGLSISAPGRASIVERDDPISGYHWHARVPPGVVQVGNTYDAPGFYVPASSRSGTRKMTFAVAQPGMYVVHGAYARRSAPKKPARTFTLRIYANPPTWPGPALVFTSRRAGGLFTDVGSVFAIALKENPSTGDSWTMKSGPGLKLLHDQVVTVGSSSLAPSLSPSPSRPGAAATQHLWLFQVETAGKTAVTGIYSRPSATAGAAAPRFLLHVEAPAPDSSTGP